jgi:hypothetical protein
MITICVVASNAPSPPEERREYLSRLEINPQGTRKLNGGEKMGFQSNREIKIAQPKAVLTEVRASVIFLVSEHKHVLHASLA